MKLKESYTPIPVSNDSDLHFLKQPTFDLEVAEKAREFANDFVGKTNSPDTESLKLAISLGWYNFTIASINDPENQRYEPRIRNRFLNLIQSEEISLNSRQLPTIGFEVESPRKPYTANNLGSINQSNYSALSSSIGFPINHASSASMWEFAPNPSYSADVQAYILNQLIKGGFIPSLSDSTNPHNIRKYLDNKLVSLHINIGLASPVEYRQEFELFNKIFAIAFTSPTRFLRKTSSNLYTIQSPTEAVKMSNGYGAGGRFEMKNMEVRDESVYRLLYEIQMLSGCMLSSIEGNENSISQIWESLKAETEPILHGKEENTNKLISDGKFAKASAFKDKIKMARIAMDKQLVKFFRTSIARSAKEAKNALQMP